MTPAIATVLSAREWEAEVVASARRTGLVRLIGRAYQRHDIDAIAAELDAVIVGAETAWLSPPVIAAWRRAGTAVIGVYPNGDRPAQRALEEAGADEVLPDSVPAEAILQSVRFLRPPPDLDAASAVLVVVTGGRGAPGRSEVAFTLAWMWAADVSVLLLEADVDAPSLALRAGRSARPDLTDAADAVRSDGTIPADAVRRVGRLSIVVGSDRPGEPLLRRDLIEDVIDAAMEDFDVVVVDGGLFSAADWIVKRADHAIAVVDASPVGIVRGARMAAEWAGPPPAVIVNRCPPDRRGSAVGAIRSWLGLDPVAVVPPHPGIVEAAVAARGPHRAMRRALRHMDVPA